MVAGILGGCADLIDEVEAGRKITGEQSSADRVIPSLPVGQTIVVEGGSQVLSGICSHGFMLGTSRSRVNPLCLTPVGRGVTLRQ